VEDTADHFFALAAGTRLDEYEIVSIIGQGSFGITYLAEDVNLGTRLAIKEYLPMQQGDVPATFASIDRLAAATGFAPATPLSEGLSRFVAWYLEYYGGGGTASPA